MEPEDGSCDGDIVTYLYNKLGKVVLLPIPKFKKGPIFKGWTKVTWEETQTEIYKSWLAMAVSRGGNIGILLGPCSGDLISLDFDDDDELDIFFEMYPWAKETMITKGRHHQLWFYMEGGYPIKRIPLKKVKGDPTIEFRGGGGSQSVIWGVHPDKMQYSMEGLPMRIEYTDLAEWLKQLKYEDWRESSEREGQDGDFGWLKQWKGLDIRELDLLGLLKVSGQQPRKVSQEKYAIKCPWMDQHTSGDGGLDAVVWQYEPKGKWFPAFKCFHAHCDDRSLKDLLDWAETRCPDSVRRFCRRSSKIPVIEVVKYNAVFTERPVLPKELIKGLLYAETKMMIAGSPKVGKTWMTMDLALDMVLGDMWFGFDTCQNMRILYLNMEMPRAFFDARLYDIEQARGITELPEDAFNVIHLRGIGLDQHLQAIVDVCEREGPFDIISIDPMYKILGDRDENSATEVADLLRDIDRLAYLAKAAVVEVHHFAKGNAADKEMGDRASGSGVWYRDADVMMTIMPAKSRVINEARIDIRARLVPIIDPFGVRWEDYRWRRDAGIDIGGSKTNEGGDGTKVPKPPKQTQADILLQILRDNPDGLTHSEWKKIAEVTFGIGASSFSYALKNIENQIKLDGKKYKISPVQS